jgi:hypothetical protein
VEVNTELRESWNLYETASLDFIQRNVSEFPTPVVLCEGVTSVGAAAPARSVVNDQTGDQSPLPREFFALTRQ